MKPKEIKSSLQCLSPNTKDKIDTDCCLSNEDSFVDVLHGEEEGKENCQSSGAFH